MATVFPCLGSATAAKRVLSEPDRHDMKAWVASVFVGSSNATWGKAYEVIAPWAAALTQ